MDTFTNCPRTSDAVLCDTALVRLRQLLTQHGWTVSCQYEDIGGRIELVWLWAAEFEEFLSVVAGKRDGVDSPLYRHPNPDGNGIVGAGAPRHPDDWLFQFYLLDISADDPDEATDIRLQISVDIPTAHLLAIEVRLQPPTTGS